MYQKNYKKIFILQYVYDELDNHSFLFYFLFEKIYLNNILYSIHILRIIIYIFKTSWTRETFNLFSIILNTY